MSQCRVFKADDGAVKECGELLRQGRLVAFPTETVYGLGANALDSEAVLKVFAVKGRPLTDPLIVHVTGLEEAWRLVEVTERERQMVEELAKRFWPGPLTMVLRASGLVPPTITANTGFIGIRVPSHKLAQRLIEESQVPIAAPSANIFNHVSPTTAAHVFNDFFDKEVAILDDGKATLGIESTVIKVSEQGLIVFRVGSLPLQEISSFVASSSTFDGLEVVLSTKKVAETESVESPGQFVKHYSPRISASLLTRDAEKTSLRLSELPLNKTAVVDFASHLGVLRSRALAYFDLSDKGLLKEAMFNFYYLLREAEDVQLCQHIIIVDLDEARDAVKDDLNNLDCLLDKAFRACSGQFTLNDFQSNFQ